MNKQFKLLFSYDLDEQKTCLSVMIVLLDASFGKFVGI